MDIIIVGKKSHNRNDQPNIIYVGQNRGDALKAIESVAGKFVRCYEVNPEPWRPMQMPAAPAAEKPAKQSGEQPSAKAPAAPERAPSPAASATPAGK